MSDFEGLTDKELLDELYALIRAYGRRISWIGEDCGEAPLMYLLRDGIEEIFEKLEGTFDLTRQKRAVKTLDAHLLRRADIARRELEAAGSSIEGDIPENHWWWYLERVVGKPTEAVSLHRAAYMEGSSSVSPTPLTARLEVKVKALSAPQGGGFALPQPEDGDAGGRFPLRVA